jgi:glycosyltransferase involved in cell wall biosynthesis
MDAVVLVNQAMRNHSRLKKLSGINFEVVNNGIPVSSVPPESPSPFLAIQPFDHLTKKIIDFCSNGFTVGSIGRLSDEKGFNYLIEALHALRQRGADVRLVIIGEGNQRFSLEKQIAALGLDDCVLLPGYVRNAKHMIACFDVFIIPSLTEGLPITLLEAMQAQVPVVATAVGGMPEVLDHGRAGVLVDPGEPISLADGIMKYLSDPNLSKQSAAKAFERANSCYNSRCMAEEYLRIYEKVSALN